MKFAVACCGTLIVLLSACSKDKEPEQLVERSEHQVLEGSIESNVLKVQNSIWADECEKNIRDVQLEIARDLDQRQPEIAALPTATSSNPKKKTILLGSISMIDLPKEAVANPGWASEYSSWSEVIATYQKIKGSPTDPNWRALNSYVRGMLSDDIERVHYHLNYELGKDSAGGLSLLQDAIAKCDADKNCHEPDLTLAQPFLASQPYYEFYTGVIKRREDLSEKREWISIFLKRVQADLRFYQFKKNELMTRADQDHFVLPLEAGSFVGFESVIQSYIENAWVSASGKSVKVEWRNAHSSPAIFRFLYKPVFGERAYVSRTEHTINLNANSSQSTVAHEVGHVMGFKDEYYTVWEPKNCRYITESREDDIMSIHQTGLVLPEHWQKLEQEYPLTTP